MAKDDYFTLVAKVLVYLYARLKGKEKTSPAQYLHPMSKDFPVSEDYFDYVLNEMMEHNYIAPVIDDDGNVIVDDSGNAVVGN